jgi:hypothetical protein
MRRQIKAYDYEQCGANYTVEETLQTLCHSLSLTNLQAGERESNFDRAEGSKAPLLNSFA